jgi:GNAT superfamily N-acetyltransferase
MALYTLTSNQVLPDIQQPDELVITNSGDVSMLSALVQVPESEIIHRLANDHEAYVAYLQGIPVAFGWVASGRARIGELNHDFILPNGNRYLWNFRTLEAYRGRGIYPALLQAIINDQRGRAKQYWIIHAPENKSSQQGIRKAGFRFLGQLGLNKEGQLALEARYMRLTEKMLAHEMGMPTDRGKVLPCWNCHSPYLKKRSVYCCAPSIVPIRTSVHL